jgi:hypothetical protein
MTMAAALPSSGGDGGGSWQAAGNCDDLKTGGMVKNQACF